MVAHRDNIDEAERLLANAIDNGRFRARHHPFYFMGTLAELYKSQKRYGEAEALAQQAYDGTRASLGPAHRETLWAMFILARVRAGQGRDDDAERLLLEAVRIRGENEATQPDWAEPRLALAEFYASRGRHDRMAEQVMLYREEHPLLFERDRRRWSAELNNLAWFLAVCPRDEARNGTKAVE